MAGKGQRTIKDLFKRKVSYQDDVEPAAKKTKEQGSSKPEEWQETSSGSLLPSNPDPQSGIQVESKYCKYCRQNEDTVTMCDNADKLSEVQDELVALTTSNNLVTEGDDWEDKPTLFLDKYSIYDESKHLVTLDSGVLEAQLALMFDGITKNVTGVGEGVPLKGTINSWWITGFSEGDKATIGLTSEYADYYLEEPHSSYSPFMKHIWQMEFLLKQVVEFVDQEEGCEDGDECYELFLERLANLDLESTRGEQLTSETVMKHAESLIKQLQSLYDNAGSTDYLDSVLIKKISEVAGVKQLRAKKEMPKIQKITKKFVDAKVTPLVRNVFENLFAAQMAADDRDDKENIKNGKQQTLQNIKEVKVKDENIPKVEVKKTKKNESFKWKSAGSKEGSKVYYEEAIIDGVSVKVGDDILLSTSDANTASYVCRIATMYTNKKDEPMAHVLWYARGEDTVLGQTGDKNELFFLDSCDDESLLSFEEKVKIELPGVPDQLKWRQLGGSEPRNNRLSADSDFFCSLWYDNELGRFEYPKNGPPLVTGDRSCQRCSIAKAKESRYELVVDKKDADNRILSVMWDQATLKEGDCIYLNPDSVKMKAKPVKPAKVIERPEVNALKYPEAYRKSTTGYVKGTNDKTPSPFVVARVVKFKESGFELKMKVALFYRPENTYIKGLEDDMSLLLWSEDSDWVQASAIQGRCWVRYSEDVDKAREWCEMGSNRWYFRSGYDSDGKTSYEVNEEKIASFPVADCPSYPHLEKKLASLDIFAGCGGLSQGLHDAGVAETGWAVELFEPAAKAFALNNKKATVFSDDCNDFLANVIDGKKHNAKKQRYPQKGEVDLLCGGPPCQGFSGMNRFNEGEYSLFKNSLIASYLSFAEYYRPRFFILENVKNFAVYKKSMVMKSCLRALVKMGYQCTFGILQAGHYGVAQTRRRVILLAAAPGEVLPYYPEPEHVFSPQACHLSVELDGQRFDTQAKWSSNAPRRTVTVRDIMSDLPEIVNGVVLESQSYDSKPKSHFQRAIRRDSKQLFDHYTKKMAPLIVKRFEYIPTDPGSDWRDLPNEVVKLSDGTQTCKLNYLYKDVKQGNSSEGHKRGVCKCADGKSKCDVRDKQTNTLIPWCLPHTGNRHNHWAGLYGRVDWDGYFSTTVTNPEPMGKQGRVLHPTQNRLVSVRECARSQGFPDHYRFHGSALEKHRQIGNAVPPPMGRALGVSILEAIQSSNAKK